MPLELEPVDGVSVRGHVVLHEPEIPNNTGSIGRTCVAMGFGLHLVHPLGFDTDEKACRRAGLDYWPRLGVREHADLDACLSAIGVAGSGGGPRVWAFTTAGRVGVDAMGFERGDVLLFGKETAGLPSAVVARFEETGVRIPMVRGERSLNLSVSAGIGMYVAASRAT